VRPAPWYPVSATAADYLHPYPLDSSNNFHNIVVRTLTQRAIGGEGAPLQEEAIFTYLDLNNFDEEDVARGEAAIYLLSLYFPLVV
jgi:hypothetical protein